MDARLGVQLELVAQLRVVSCRSEFARALAIWLMGSKIGFAHVFQGVHANVRRTFFSHDGVSREAWQISHRDDPC